MGMTHTRRMAALAPLVAISLGCRAQPPATAAAADEAATRAGYEAWRAGRLEELRKDDGWLALAGLHWLDQGEARIGSSADSAIVLPASAPPFLGVIRVDGKAVTLTMATGVAASLGGAPFSAGALRSDEDPQAPQDRVRVGDVTLSIIDRGGKLALRVHDARAQTRTGFAGIETFPWDPRWIVRGRLERFDAPRKVAVPTAIGIDDEATVPGAIAFEIDGVALQLEPYVEEGDDEMFIVFADATNGKETYGGGRFLTAKLPPAGSDAVILDFNRAFSPPCSFTPYATCPVPRPENRLPIAVTAGERSKAHHQP